MDPEGGVCVLRGGEEEQTPGASVSGLRPWRQGLVALTEVATNADVQTPLTHTHTLAHSRREEQDETAWRRGRKRQRSSGASLGNQ